MIQDYLKTSLVFYDEITKQHRYSDCCQDTTQYNGLISPRDRFLPFQIRIDTDVWFGDISTITLYDTDDNVAANLITDYGMRNVVDVLSNCNWTDLYVWVIYNGGTLSANLPEGDHYIRITDDAGNDWYSEIFTICDLTQVDTLADEDVIREWINGTVSHGTFDAFVSDGSNVTMATYTPAGAGLGGAETDIILGRTGDRFSIVVNHQKYSGSRIWSLFLVEYDDDTVIMSNALNMNTGSGVYTATLTTTGNGPYKLIIRVVGVVGDIVQQASSVITMRKIIAGTYDGMIGIEWYNDCDFNDIIYQSIDNWHLAIDSFVNRLYFPVKLESPRTETTKNGNERLGEFFTDSIIQKKYYMFKVLVPEFLYNVLQTLQLYANNARSIVNIFLDNGDIGEVMELNIIEEWIDGNCYAHLTIEFREEAVVWTNCCDNYALVDESSCS